MTVTYKEHTEAKSAFLKRHGKKDWRVETSPMNSDGVYYKTYACGDGAVWYERMSPAWRTAEAEVEVEGIRIVLKKDVKLFETEFWSSDNANSRKYYEKF